MNNNENSFPGNNDNTPDSAAPTALELTICRIVDGESTEQDRERFRTLAADAPQLWRELAEQRMQLDMLTERVDLELESALSVELPHDASDHESTGLMGSVRWLLAFSGWAALVACALVWSAMSLRPDASADLVEQVTPVQLTADEHFDEYLTAPNVLGELEPVVLEVEELPDGRIAIRYLRRVEEFVFVKADELGELPSNPILDSRVGGGL